MRLLGITGRVLEPKTGEFCSTAGAGKDEVASCLMRQHGYVPYALARPIKAMLSALPGMELYKWDDREWKEGLHPLFGVTRRHMAQALGTEWRDMICKNLWLRIAEFEWLKVRETTAPGMVISDIRFDHEVDWLRQLGGELIVVIRNTGVRPVKALHTSEMGVTSLSTDHFLYNLGTLEELYAKTDELAKTLAGVEVLGE